MKKKVQLRVRRIFSETLRQRVVLDIEKGAASISRVMQEYGISQHTVYRWLNKYSRHLQSNKTIVMQMDSEAYKTKELENRVKELEAALGRKQMEVDYLNKMIELGKETLGVDLKKKLGMPPSSGSETSKGSTGTK